MNINYINESVISVAVMRRKRTHMHEANRERTVYVCVRAEDVCCGSTKRGSVQRWETGTRFVNE